jgi:hypothetical protein
MTDDEIERKAAEIKNTVFGRVLSEFLQIRKRKAMNAMIAAKDSNTLRQLQGRAQEDDELIKMFTIPENK